MTRRDPLAPNWVACSLEPPHAGTTAVARVVVENGGSATWRSRDDGGLLLAYHWLDPLGNPIVWDGRRTRLPRPVAPGERLEIDLGLDTPRPPGRYRLVVDLVEEHRFWLQEIGCAPLQLDVEVAPRIASRRLSVVIHGETGEDDVTRSALARQEEVVLPAGADADAFAHLVTGAEPDPEWSRRVLDAHAEGFAAVGVAVIPAGSGLERRRARRRLAPWAPAGRTPRFAAPLLLPSLLAGLEPETHLGLPAYDGPDGLFDGRVTIRLPTRSGRRHG
jgi:hypothetical protein